MNYKHLFWIIPLIFIIGFMLGQLYKFPTQFNVEFKIENKTQLLMNRYYNLSEVNIKNICCYPLDCSQSKNNPDICTCEYLVACYPDTPSKYPILIKPQNERD